MKEKILNILKTESEINRVELCKLFGPWTKRALSELSSDELIEVNLINKIPVVKITNKGLQWSNRNFCFACECDPCDCDWGN